MPEPALKLLEVAELEAQLAHETGHAYFWGDDAPASAMDYRRAKDLELLCDAIALATLHRLRLDPSRLMTGIEKITRYNWKFESECRRKPLPHSRGTSEICARGDRLAGTWKPSFTGMRETKGAEGVVRSRERHWPDLQHDKEKQDGMHNPSTRTP